MSGLVGCGLEVVGRSVGLHSGNQTAITFLLLNYLCRKWNVI